MNRSPSNEFQDLWSAVERHAQATGHAAPRSVLVIYPDGSLSECSPAGCVEEEWGDTPGTFPAALGWSFRAGSAAFNGLGFRLSGLRYKLLRVLVAAKGEAVRDRVLKARVWRDGATDDTRLKDVAFGLRAALRAELGLGAEIDPVERVDGGYRLVLG